MSFRPVRFKTELRGLPVEVEMEILAMYPAPKFSIIFHEGAPETKLTRAEIAALCREAQRRCAS